MPALEWITIEGFRSIKAIERLELTPINVVIGSNGSGKSNFINVFSFLNAIREGKLQEYVARAGGADSILHFGSKVTPEILLKLAFSGEINQYEIRLHHTENDSLVPILELAYYWEKSKYSSPYGRVLKRSGDEAGISQSIQNGITSYVRGHLAKWRLYHFHDTGRSSPMKLTNDINDNEYLRSDGSNLASFLYLLQEKYPENYSLIRRSVQRVTPFFDDFRLRPQSLNEDKIRLEWSHKGSDSYFDASSLSDGSLRFIALATLFLQPQVLQPSIILVDEPELGLHPYAITMLTALMRQASITSQVILSTQSALLLDQFTPEEVLVADRVDNGTTLQRLSSESLKDWLEEYSLGQLWEKAEFGGRPGSHR